MTDSNFTGEIGLPILQPGKRAHCVLNAHQDSSDFNRCLPPSLLRYQKKISGEHYFFQIKNSKM